VEVKPAAIPLVPPDVLVDALVADHGQLVLPVFEPAAYLLRAPALFQLVFDESDDGLSHFPGTAASFTLPAFGLRLSPMVIIAGLVGVPAQFPADRRAVNGNVAGNCRLRQSSFQQRVNLASCFVGQVTVFLHRSPQWLSKIGGYLLHLTA
jgi:hypothetical protein